MVHRGQGLRGLPEEMVGAVWAHRCPGLMVKSGGDALLFSYSQKVIPFVFVELFFL